MTRIGNIDLCLKRARCQVESLVDSDDRADKGFVRLGLG